MIGLKLTTEAIRDLAEVNGVCVRPVVHEVTDTTTGQVRLIPTPCGATLASKCRPCAHRNRVLRMQQCREGWHLEQEPEARPADDAEDEPRSTPSERRIRSTRRRQDAPDLPTVPIENRTVGIAFTTSSGRTYRPSMFATFTLPSYGPVRSDGTPVHPRTYNYRRAALDAMHFPKLVDRLWQNLRRTVGYKVQYFAVVEPQRRLAPHLHAAVRGAIPREVFRQVVAATYHQIWWPPNREPVYSGVDLPVWDEQLGYVDPHSHEPLRTWDQALDDLDCDDDARPAHVLRFGKQLDLQGIIATEGDADRRVAYLTKYLSKSFGQAYADEQELTWRQRRHAERLHDEVRFLPCSPRCWNWLRFGIQPALSHEGQRPGECPGKAHRREHLGCGGRRVLVSRKWTGKRLSDHKADRVSVVRQVLESAGIELEDAQRLAADVRDDEGRPRFEWKVWNPLEATTPVYRQVLTRSIAEKLRWRAEYQAAKARAGPETTLPHPPDRRPPQVVAASVKGERSESRSDP